jgi:hypothetical protein
MAGWRVGGLAAFDKKNCKIKNGQKSKIGMFQLYSFSICTMPKLILGGYSQSYLG